MEKGRLCLGRFVGQLVLITFTAFSHLQAQAPIQAESIVEVQVSVEEAVKAGDSAGSLEAARQAAFKKAVEMAFPPGISEDEKKTRLNNAASYIKSFRTLSQIEEAGVVKLSMLCQVIQNVAAPTSEPQLSSPQSYTSRVVSIELVWRPGMRAYLASEIKRLIEEDMRIPVRSLRLQNGSVVVDLGSDESSDLLFAKVNSRFQDRALVRLLNAPATPETQGWTPTP